MRKKLVREKALSYTKMLLYIYISNCITFLYIIIYRSFLIQILRYMCNGGDMGG